jgi:hypothetical protein
MTFSPQDAADALRVVETTERQSATLRGYQRGSPHLILWGVIWAIGDGLTEFFPAYAALVWAVLVPAGLVAGFLLMRRDGRTGDWRYGAIALAMAFFFGAMFFVMAPVNARQVAAVIALVVALAYVIRGLWWGPRYVVTGVAVAVLTMVGFILLKEYFLLWTAVIGGGALILAGLWLRQV